MKENLLLVQSLNTPKAPESSLVKVRKWQQHVFFSDDLRKEDDRNLWARRCSIVWSSFFWAGTSCYIPLLKLLLCINTEICLLRNLVIDRNLFFHFGPKPILNRKRSTETGTETDSKPKVQKNNFSYIVLFISLQLVLKILMRKILAQKEILCCIFPSSKVF